MNIFNLKITVFAMLLVLLAAPVLAEPPAESSNTTEKLTVPTGKSPNYQMLINTIKAVLFVAVFGTAAIFITKKLAPKITNSAGKSIRILENVSLGQRRSLHLIEIQGKKILLGSSIESITKLCEFDPETQTDPLNCEDQHE